MTAMQDRRAAQDKINKEAKKLENTLKDAIHKIVAEHKLLTGWVPMHIYVNTTRLQTFGQEHDEYVFTGVQVNCP